MKKYIILIVAFICCVVFVGFTGFYLGSKTANKSQYTSNVSSQSDNSTENTTDIEQIKSELRAEIRAEVQAEYISQINDLQNQINELIAYETELAEQEPIEEEPTQEVTPPVQETTQPVQQSSTQDTTPVQQKPAYLNVHDVTCSISGGSSAIEAALRSAVDSSSGVAMADADSITGIGTFPIYWTSSDGATATSYITITE